MQKEYKAIATQCLCNWGGIVILEINSDCVKSGFDYGRGLDRVKTTKLYYNNNGDCYFYRYKTKYFLNNFIRCNY